LLNDKHSFYAIALLYRFFQTESVGAGSGLRGR
jgi:hypothetical protein